MAEDEDTSKTIRMKGSLWQRILDQAERLGISASAYVKIAITEKLEIDESRGLR